MKFIYLMLIVIHSVYCQQIFTIPPSTCQYALAKNDTLLLNSETFLVTRRKTQVYVNLCNNLDNNACGPSSIACIMVKGKGKNAGTSFEYISDKDYGKVLKSINGEKCEDSENYSVTILFDKSDTAKPLPTIQEVDECNITIQFPHPKVIPYCTTRDHGYLLNMQSLKNLPPLTNTTNNVTYTISLCSSTDSCLNSEIAGCESKEGIFISPISTVSSQKVRYDYNTNIMSIKSSYKEPGKKRRLDTEVVLKCNWDVEMGALIKTAKKSSFEVETKQGCIKLPMNCVFTDDKYFVYNISNLNRPNGGWNVKKVPGGSIQLNVCGPLNLKNQCKGPHSQMCLTNNSLPKSLGSTYIPIKESDDALHLDLFHGSVCKGNSSTGFYTSKIKFLCNRIEKGPVFVKEVNCLVSLLWETPEACPRYVTGELYNRTRLEDTYKKNIKECSVNHEGLLYNLAPLISENYYEVRNKSFHYFINICRPLLVTDETYLCRSSGFCINDLNSINIKTKYTSLNTISNPEVVNGSLVLKYFGGMCSNFQLYQAIIRFTCSQTEKSLYLISKSDCYLELGWYTKHACPKVVHKIRSSNCIVRNRNLQKLVDLKNISIINFKLKFMENYNYLFDLCEYNYTITSLNDNKTKEFNMTDINYKQEECSKVIEYVLSSDECTNGSLNRVHIYLECNPNRVSDDFAQLKFENCINDLRFKSHDVCHLFTDYDKENCGDYKIKTDMQKEKTVSQYVADKTSSFIETYRNCSISGENGSLFILKDVPEFMVNTSRNYYHIGYSKKNVLCDGFVCQNNRTVASLQICPSMAMDSIDPQINAHFTIEKFNTELVFVCGNDNDTATILTETENGVKIKVPLKQSCNVLKHVGIDHITDAHTGLIIGIIILLVLIAVSLFLIIRHKGRYSKMRLLNDKCSVPVYYKDGLL